MIESSHQSEAKLQSACLKLLRAELKGAVIIKHSDTFSAGVPDVSVTWRGKTIWLEFKHGPKIKWANALQQLTCRRLAAAGFCWVVLYEEPIKRTVILTPDEEPVDWMMGFDHRFVVDFVRRVHGG